MTTKRKYILIGAFGVLLVVGSLCASLATLNSRWLHDKLIAKAAVTLDAELTIDSIEFHPFEGRAALAGGRVVRTSPTSQLDVRFDDAKVELALMPLLVRQLVISRLELAGPSVTCERELPARTRSAGTLARMKRFVKDRVAVEPDGAARVEIEIPPLPPDNWRVGEFVINGGRAEYNVVRPDEAPFHAVLTSLDYAARNISLHSLTNLLNGADIRGVLEMGKTATLEKIGSQSPGTLAIRGLDLAELDRLLDQTDALAIAGGTLDASYTAAHDRFDISVVMHELEVAQNPDAASDELLFIPVEKLGEHVAKHGQRLDLEFTIDANRAAASDDLMFIAEEFWDGLLAALMKDVGARSKDQLLDKAAEKLSDWVERKAPEQP